MQGMADSERKKLVWATKRDLLTLSADELFQIAKLLGPMLGMDQSCLKPSDDEACFEYISSFMYNKPLLESEDSDMAHLLEMKDVADLAIQGYVSDSKMHVIGDDVSHGSFLNPQADVASVEENHTNVDFNPVMTIDIEATEVCTANANHLLAATAMTTNDTEIQKILLSYEKLHAEHTNIHSAVYTSVTCKNAAHVTE